MKKHMYAIVRVTLAGLLIAGTLGVNPVLAEKMDYGTSIAVDSSGGAYFTGFVTNGPENEDDFLTKWEASGNPIWSNFVAGPAHDANHGVALDGDGDVYVAGAFLDSMEFDLGAGTSTLTSGGDLDLFISTQIHYVKWNATGANNGTSWADAYTDLQSALAAAADPGDEIWVAAGTYKPTSGTDRTISFTLKNGVAVYGGFAGTETAREQRDVSVNLTVLSGDIGAAGDANDNSYHVVIGSDTDHSAILDGFTITAGNADDTTAFSPNGQGGGMYIDKGNPGLNELIFIGNYAEFGGGLYAVHEEGNDHAVDLILTNVIFRDNNAAWEGGGMAVRFMPDLSSASFSLSLTGVTFDSNTVTRTGGGLSNSGGELTLVDVTFSGNTSTGGGGLSHIPFGQSTLTNVTFRDNSASDGGGGMLVGSSGPTLTTLTNVTFDNNTTALNGGGLANAGLSELSLTNVSFSDNTAGVNGGGISNGVLDIEGEGTINLINTTLSNNTANSTGSAIYNESGTINVHNSILYGNAGEEISGAANVTYSIVQGGYTGAGNIDADPLLGPLQDNGGFTHTMALSADSPAIDAGDDANCPDLDQRGIERPQGSHCDIGAYEYQDITLPGKATPVSPSGNIGMNNPTYTWNEVPEATWYYLWINDSAGNIFKQWYTSAQTNCNGTTCSLSNVTPGLTAGTYTWWIQTWNEAGYGPWSDAMIFSPAVPAAASLISPSGNIGISNPTYTWNEVPEATWYYLWINDSTGNIFKQWYTSAQTNCNVTCSITPPVSLSSDSYTWWIQTWNDVGYGAWSTAMIFNRLPGAATLSSPSGTATNHPTYTWNEVPGSAWYYLWVDGPAGNIIKQWYTADIANCNGTTCSITPDTTLSSGEHRWWIRTWNDAGYGPWSTRMDFLVP